MSDGDLKFDSREAGERLVSVGMSETPAAAKAGLFADAASALAGDGTAMRAFFVPGRLECLGKHTDYAGGRSLICAVERGFCVVSRARQDPVVRVLNVARADSVEFMIRPGLAPPLGHWSNYPMTVARRLARNFGRALRGADIAFASDLPVAAGMSSSSALVVACYLALAAGNELFRRKEYRRNIEGPEALAGYIATIENGRGFGSLRGDRGVGTFGGSEDHTAMLCARAGLLSLYSYCPVSLERTVAVPDGYVFAIAASGVAAEKTGEALEKYNRASRLAAAAVGAWNKATGRGDEHLAAALRGDAGAADRIRSALRGAGAKLLRRFEHFLAESEQIIPAACEALAGGDVAAFGSQVDRSQKLAEELLGNQIPQTSFLAASARQAGAAAASSFGAGFGGAVWALIDADGARDFLTKWADAYGEAFPKARGAAEFFLTRPGPAATCVCGG